SSVVFIAVEFRALPGVPTMLGMDRRSRLVELGIMAGIAGPIVSWGLTFVVIAGWPGYDPIRQSISLLATSPLGWVQTLAFAARPTLVAAGLAVVSIALVPATIDGPLTPFLGLLERLFVAIPSVWQVAAGLFAWRRSSDGRRRRNEGLPATQQASILAK